MIRNEQMKRIPIVNHFVARFKISTHVLLRSVRKLKAEVRPRVLVHVMV